MDISCPGVRPAVVDGQTLAVLSAQAWTELWRNPWFGGVEVARPAELRRQVDALVPYRRLVTALDVGGSELRLHELLRVQHSLYRVRVESVACTQCGHRAKLCATIAVDEIYVGAIDERAARARCERLPRQSCFACGVLLEPRTVWRAT